MNATKDARIGDFGYRLGKTRIGTSTWTYLGCDAEGGVFSKRAGQDERGRRLRLLVESGPRLLDLREVFSGPYPDAAESGAERKSEIG